MIQMQNVRRPTAPRSASGSGWPLQPRRTRHLRPLIVQHRPTRPNHGHQDLLGRWAGHGERVGHAVACTHPSEDKLLGQFLACRRFGGLKQRLRRGRGHKLSRFVRRGASHCGRQTNQHGQGPGQHNVRPGMWPRGSALATLPAHLTLHNARRFSPPHGGGLRACPEGPAADRRPDHSGLYSRPAAEGECVIVSPLPTTGSFLTSMRSRTPSDCPTP